MKSVQIDQIKELAQKLAIQNKKWHFHLLTPGCKLNTSSQFALVLENGTDKESFVYLAEEKPMDVGKELLELLHGKEVLHKEDHELGEVSSSVMQMMLRAKELNGKGFFWHHHVLFPYCIYNQHAGKWTIIFEDPEKKEIIESVSDTEPKRDLKEIEPAFYKQNIMQK